MPVITPLDLGVSFPVSFENSFNEDFCIYIYEMQKNVIIIIFLFKREIGKQLGREGRRERDWTGTDPDPGPGTQIRSSHVRQEPSCWSHRLKPPRVHTDKTLEAGDRTKPGIPCGTQSSEPRGYILRSHALFPKGDYAVSKNTLL